MFRLVMIHALACEDDYVARLLKCSALEFSSLLLKKISSSYISVFLLNNKDCGYVENLQSRLLSVNKISMYNHVEYQIAFQR